MLTPKQIKAAKQRGAAQAAEWIKNHRKPVTSRKLTPRERDAALTMSRAG